MTDQINKREVSVASTNVQKIDNTILNKVEASMDDLDSDIRELDSDMTVIRDRMVESSEVGFAISLARFAEIKLSARRQKIELIKTMIQYKSGEQAMKKRSSDATSSIQDIMAGVGIGAMVASNGTKLNVNGTQPISIEVERTDIVDAEVELEPGETTSTVNNILKNLN